MSAPTLCTLSCLPTASRDCFKSCLNTPEATEPRRRNCWESTVAPSAIVSVPMGSMKQFDRRPKERIRIARRREWQGTLTAKLRLLLGEPVGPFGEYSVCLPPHVGSPDRSACQCTRLGSDQLRPRQTVGDIHAVWAIAPVIFRNRGYRHGGSFTQ